VKTKSAPKSAPDQPVPLASYIAEFEQWMATSVRCRKSSEAEDIRQEIRLALWELRDVPATRDEARLIFLRLASRFESRARRQVFRQGALVEQPEELADAIERDAVRSLALFNALEKLSAHEQWLVKECKIEGRSHEDVAKHLGISHDTVRNRLWRAMTKLLAVFKDEENRGNGRKSHAIVAPLAFEFTDVQRAAFSAIWRAEGRVPTFGGGPPNPPGPPPVVSGVPPVAVAPVVSAAVGSAVSAATVAIVLVLLILVPTGIVAIYYFWDPPHAQTANKGLRALPISVVEDVVPMDFVPPRQRSSTQTPATSSSASVQGPPSRTSSSSTSVHSSDAPSSSPPIDPEEIDRARRRRPPRFLPSR